MRSPSSAQLPSPGIGQHIQMNAIRNLATKWRLIFVAICDSSPCFFPK